MRRPRISQETAQLLDEIKNKIKHNVLEYLPNKKKFLGDNGRVKNDKVIKEALKKIEKSIDDGEYWKEG